MVIGRDVQSGRRELNQGEQLLKFKLLPHALEIIKKSGTIQEYKTLLTLIGKPSANNGSVPIKNVECWEMTALVGEHKTSVKAILRPVGDGNITFWSVMPARKIKKANRNLH